MKYYLALAALLLAFLLLNRIVSGQVPDVKDLAHYKEIARDDRIMYFVNVEDMVRLNPRFVTMNVMGAHYVMDPDGEHYKLNNVAYIVTTWRIDCQEKTGQRLKDKGVWMEKRVDKSYKHPKVDKPTKSRNLYIAIQLACEPDSDDPETARVDEWVPITVPNGLDASDASRGSKSTLWIGGNGCNLMGGGKAEQACCAQHDFAYRSGGNMRVKWAADAALFKCVWKRNKLLAPFVFVGAQVGGLFAFRWGRPRELRTTLVKPVIRSTRVKQ